MNRTDLFEQPPLVLLVDALDLQDQDLVPGDLGPRLVVVALVDHLVRALAELGVVPHVAALREVLVRAAVGVAPRGRALRDDACAVPNPKRRHHKQQIGIKWDELGLIGINWD
eukprot:SAG31_NODE_1864_length_7036_cov_3.477584_10_plen_113_part_00